ncbi:MAG: hypothetical protein GX357_02735 [Firmicutes bacterium]|nr:hypothetical protein [Bacillota bacterium]
MFTRQKKIFPVGFITLSFCLGLAVGIFVMQLPAMKKQNNIAAAESAGFCAAEAESPGGPVEVQRKYQGYLGVYNNHLAVYDGLPPHGILKYVMMDYVARDDIRAQLEAGVPFTDTYDLLRILENYTS